MDHMLIPEGTEHISVPYRCTEPYDDGDFMTYPERKGWTRAEIRGDNNYGGRRAELESFLQTWLYFGCITQIFKIAETQIDDELFIDRERGTVTAKDLPSLIQEWQKRWPKPASECKCSDSTNPNRVDCKANPCWKTFQTDLYSPEFYSIKSILNDIHRVIGDYCYNAEPPGKPLAISKVFTSNQPVSPEIIATIVALGFTLQRATNDIYSAMPERWSNEWGYPPLLRALLEKKWCPLQVTWMMPELDVGGYYYITALPESAERRAHSICTKTSCILPNIDESTYKTKHTTEKQCCDPISVPTDFLNIIKCKGTPIVSWIQNQSGGEARLTEYNASEKKTPKYIAISHVWSDGLGNPTSNALPECQMSRIQKMVDEVRIALMSDIIITP